MLLFQSLGAFALATAAFAQGFDIGSPSPAQTLSVGSAFTVEVDQPALQGPFMSVSVVISLQYCGDTPCTAADNDEVLGDILYAGSFSPQRHEISKPPYENFTLNVASGIKPGNANLHVAQFYVMGAGPTPQVTTKNVSVTIGSPQVAKRVSRIIRI